MGGISKIHPKMIDGKLAVDIAVVGSKVTVTFNDASQVAFDVSSGGGGSGVTVTGFRLSATDIAGNSGGAVSYVPSVTLGADSITSAGSLVVNVTGAPPSSTVSVSLKDSLGVVKASSTFTVNANGAGSGTSSPGVAAGAYSVVVTFDPSKNYSSGNTVTKALTVTAASSTSYIPRLSIANADITATSVKINILAGPPNSSVAVKAQANSNKATVFEGPVALNASGSGVVTLTGLTHLESYLVYFDFAANFTYDPAYSQHLATYVTTL